MVPRNAARRHVCEQAAEEPPPPNAGTLTSCRKPGIRQQRRPPRSVKICEANKRMHHAKSGILRYSYATLVHETHGRVWDEAKERIRMLADEACSHISVHRPALVGNLKTKPSVATVKGNALVSRACISQMARKKGKEFRKGATCPHAKVG